MNSSTLTKSRRIETEKNCIASLSVEQLKLAKIEKEIKTMLQHVNQHINTLRVEEFELKANYVDNISGQNNDDQYNDTIKLDPASQELSDDSCEINKQFIELDAFVNQLEEELDSD